MKTNTEHLFGRFRAIYGGRWTACYTTPEAVDLAIAEWSEVIERMSDEQLLEAISWAKTCCPWPPSIAEFLHAGLGIDEVLIRETAVMSLGRWFRDHCTEGELAKAIKIRRDEVLRGLIAKGLGPALEDRSSAQQV